MSKGNYTHIQLFEKEINAMKAAGYTKRQIAERLGLKKEQIKEFLKRQRRKERQIEAGIEFAPKGRPLKNCSPVDIQLKQAHEIERLRMENKLLRDFLQSTGRK